MTAPCKLSHTIWKCDLARKNGYTAVVLWATAKAPAGTSWVSEAAKYQQYRDLEGNVHKIIDRSIPVSNEPILVETATAF
jgi:hypothetical protein